jgi:hypothetical protein
MFITHQKSIVVPSYLEFGYVKIEVVTKFKLLGVQIDSNLSFDSFIKNTCL